MGRASARAERDRLRAGQATEAKLARIRDLGAELRQVGADFDDAKDSAAAYAEEEGLPLFVDGLEPGQFTGYRTIGDEIASALDGRAGTVVVPVGNGALTGGVGEALAGSGWQVVGVVAKEAL